MTLTFSIKRRIIAAVVAAELLLVLCLVLVAGVVMRRNSLRSFDATLHGRAMTMAALVRYSEDAHPELQFDGELLPASLTQEAPDMFRVETRSGRILASSTTP